MSKEPIFRLFKPPLECQRPICRLCVKRHSSITIECRGSIRVSTVHGHKYSWPLIFYYIFHIKPHFFKNIILKLSLDRFLWNLFQVTQKSLNFICLSDNNLCLHGFCFLVISRF
jgi:hypothetical protein